MSIVLGGQRLKSTPNAVTGKIVVTSSSGERVSQWGGTECYLSWQTALGPCLVVRSSRHRKGAGTFFPLKDIRQVLASFLNEGKLTLVAPHGLHVCTILIHTMQDIEELFTMAHTIQDKSQWHSIEKNVGSKRSREANDARDDLQLGASTLGAMDGLNTDNPLVEEVENTPSDVEDNHALPPDRKEETKPSDSRLEKHHSPSQSRKDSALAADALEVVTPSNWSTEARRALHQLLAGRNVFLTGAAGTGKTAWLLHVMENVLPKRVVRYTATATTGVAARQLGGRTIYSFAGIGKGEGTLESILQRVQSHSDVVRGWRDCQLLIIDEISVLPAHIFTLLDKVARALRKKPSQPFGGLQLLLIGDFLQLPPVSRGGEEVLSAFQSSMWNPCNFACVELRTNYRHAEDPVLQQACEDVRRGLYTTAVKTVTQACLHRSLETRAGVEPTTLLCRLKDVESHNQKRLEELETVSFQRYFSEDYAAEPGTSLDSEFSLPATLTLKAGAQVVLIAAISDYPELANGDLGVVISFQEQFHGEMLPVVRFITPSGVHKGREIIATVPRVKMEVSEPGGRYVALARTQVPLQLAWALTVHRVQGMTISMTRVQLDHSFFEFGQAYVALSRVRCSKDLCLMAFDPTVIRASPAAVAFYKKTFPLSVEEEEAIQDRVLSNGKVGGLG